MDVNRAFCLYFEVNSSVFSESIGEVDPITRHNKNYIDYVTVLPEVGGVNKKCETYIHSLCLIYVVPCVTGSLL